MSYSSKDIQILEGLEHIRKRPHMYIGSTDIDGMHHLLREVVDNAIDEYLDKYVTKIKIKIDTRSNTAEIYDNGRGIPISKHPKAGVSTLEAVFSRLHAGGKFGKGAYTGAIVGLHGIGVKAVNALSSSFDVWTNRRSATWHISFVRGKVHRKIHHSKKKLRKGTLVRFVPDVDVFGDARWDINRIRDWLYTISCLCPGLRIDLLVDDKHESFSENSLCDILPKVDVVNDKYIEIKSNDFEAVFAWTIGEGEDWNSFVNVVNTPDHGTHVSGLKKAIQDSINTVAGTKIKGNYIRTGIIAVIHARVTNPQFRGQTKTRLENKDIYDSIYQQANDFLVKYWVKNKQYLESIVAIAKSVASAKKKYLAERTAIKSVKVKKGASGILPGKLIEAPDCPDKFRELFICEGDSAEGIVTKARLMRKVNNRMVHFQEVYPLRGKLPNAARSSNMDIVTKNEVVRDLFTAIGTGVGRSFSLDKCRYSKIYLLADADPDGRHIVALLLSLFVVYVPDIIKAGKVAVIQNPLFMGVSGKKRVYGDSIEEVNKAFLPKEKVVIRRFKGLGESNPQELQDYAMNSKTRKVLDVVWDDRTQDAVISYMGDDVGVRKLLLNV